MIRNLLVTLFLFFSTSIAFAQKLSWEEQFVVLINQERSSANDREWAIYGAYANGFRGPLTINPRLTASAQLWCNALKGSNYFDHYGYVTNQGYLRRSYYDWTQISRVWLPSKYNNYTDWTIRNEYFGVFPTASSENGYLGGGSRPRDIFNAWKAGTWNIDPRLASGHYSNMINPRWIEVGIAKNTWGGGKNSCFADFADFR